jgi:hypothetical protein
MAEHSFNTLLQYRTGSSGPFTALAEVVDIQRSGNEVTSSNASHLRVPQAFMLFLPGLINPGELTFTLRYNRADAQIINEFLTTRRTVTWRVVTLSADLWQNSGFVTLQGEEIPEDNVINQNVTIKFTGISTYTPNS